MTVAYYLPDGPFRWMPTEATESPWDTDAQHGGPPLALAAHVMETHVTDTGAGPEGAADHEPAAGRLRTARVTMEFLGALPRRPLTVEATVTRPGRRVRMLEATVEAEGRTVAVARAWQIAGTGSRAEQSGHQGTRPPPVPGPQTQRYFPGLLRWGYGESIEWRWLSGGYDEPGPASVWARIDLPLVAGEAIRPLERALVLADSANGVSGVLPQDRWLFVPPSVTVTVHRPPTGSWIHLAAETTLAGDGLASTLGVLADEAGPIGTVTQPVLVMPR